MDRTGIAPWKAEEKEKGEKLHEKLQGLALLYPMSEEMSKLLSWEMFLKPNQAAFFQVMHYLFRILDPVEFKKRFYWPITDKKAEATFRSSTVEYLKHLNEKHQLNWTNIKSYLVVMPGGMRFINFLLDLVGFVIQELIKQREKFLLADGIDIESKKNLSAQQMSAQSTFMKEYASQYIDEVKKATTRYRTVTQKIREVFNDIATKTKVEESLLLHDKFLEDFKAYNRCQYEKKLAKVNNELNTLDAPQGELKEAMDQFLSRQIEGKQQQDAANATYHSIQKFIGHSAEAEHATGNALLTTLNSISATVAEQLDANDHYNESNEFVTADLKELLDKVQQLELQVNEVQRNLNLRIKEHQSNVSANETSTPMRLAKPQSHVTNPLMLKFISTPPIKPEAVGTGTGAVRKVNVRLPLQDDFNEQQFENTCNSLMAAPRSVRKTKTQLDQSIELNSTVNRSKVFDPNQLWRTINKESKPRPVSKANLSSLGSKWKQLHAPLNFDDPTSPKSNMSLPVPQSPFTPLNCNEHTRIERMQAMQLGDSSNSSLNVPKNVAVMKVMDASLNVQNLSTSPSGRLDALVAAPLTKETPKLQLNNQSLNDSATLISEPVNPPALNLSCCFLENDDYLQNISDTVLNDIAF